MKKLAFVFTVILSLCLLVSCGGDTPEVTKAPKAEKVDLTSFSICAATGVSEEINKLQNSCVFMWNHLIPTKGI